MRRVGLGCMLGDGDVARVITGRCAATWFLENLKFTDMSTS